MRNRIIAIGSLLVLAMATQVASAQSLPDIKVASVGKTKSACIRNSSQDANDRAWRTAMRMLDLPSQFMGCMQTAVPDAVALKSIQVDYKNVGSCETLYKARFDRIDMLRASRLCLQTDKTIPVGVLLRADVDHQDNAQLAKTAIGQLTSTLERRNFKIINLNNFENDIQDLSLMQECTISGAADEGERSDRCRRKFGSYAQARDALVSRLRSAVEAYRGYDADLAEWDSCGGMLIIGEIGLTSDGRDVNGRFNADYLGLSELASAIAPFSDARTVEIDLGGKTGAVIEAAALLVESSAQDATQKLASFSHSVSCNVQN